VFPNETGPSVVGTQDDDPGRPFGTLTLVATDRVQRDRVTRVPNGNAAQRSMIAGAALVFPGPDTGPTLPPFAFVMRWTVLQVVLRPTGNAEL
jgi:hypothetical protein